MAEIGNVQENVLEKTNRINLQFDFYAPLLTDKQRTFLTCYFHENLSLGEIASEFEISRQAVYEHIKRAETTLEDYESKLRLVAKHELRMKRIGDLEALLVKDRRAKQPFMNLLNELKQLD